MGVDGEFRLLAPEPIQKFAVRERAAPLLILRGGAARTCLSRSAPMTAPDLLR